MKQDAGGEEAARHASVPPRESGASDARREGPYPGNVRIRPMSPGDLSDVLEIERASFPTPWAESTFRNLMRRANARLWVAESLDGATLGYAVAWFASDEAELGDLAVNPGARGQGVGRALLDAVLEGVRGQGIRSVFLAVRESNDAARRLYERAGFETVGRQAGYYSVPTEDALVLSLAIACEVR